MPDPTLEATLTSKGQITLPKLLRERLGLEKGCRIRFLVETQGRFQGEAVVYDLEDLWAMADEAPRPRRVMTARQMDAAKARRKW
jgi:AbrB family looped-hinge helix DNA binding protein